MIKKSPAVILLSAVFLAMLACAGCVATESVQTEHTGASEWQTPQLFSTNTLLGQNNFAPGCPDKCTAMAELSVDQHKHTV